MPINFETQFNQTETRYLRTVGITVGFSNSDLDVCKFASRLIYSKVLVQLFSFNAHVRMPSDVSSDKHIIIMASNSNQSQQYSAIAQLLMTSLLP